MSEGVNNNFYQPVEVSPGVTKNFIKNPEDARKLADITENQGLKAAREAEKEMATESTASLMEKIDNLNQRIKSQAEDLDRWINHNQESRDMIDKQQVDVFQNYSSYDKSIKAITEVLSPTTRDEGKTVQKPEVPYEISKSKENRTFTLESAPAGFKDHNTTVEDSLTTFSSSIVTQEGKLASLKLTTHKYGEKLGGDTITLRCTDDSGKNLVSSFYSVVDSRQAAHDFIGAYKSLNQPKK